MSDDEASNSSDRNESTATPGPVLDLNLDPQNNDWSDVLVDIAVKLELFREFSGPVLDLPVDSQPLDYFKLFFPEWMLQMFVDETNEYAKQQQRKKGANDPYWKPATMLDIRKYIYTLITFGHCYSKYHKNLK
ncbi:PiggyBac transposable element derived 4 [Elysia marginata]|uniref:PiggyBac transposable element derived 4 n=1 Tax=Elysia marginata TaxID=1093978 RepID=A0AAV4ERY6_9GAST|nr:PiggyBac transposable element derived 4 [Elysia marginata]